MARPRRKGPPCYIRVWFPDDDARQAALGVHALSRSLGIPVMTLMPDVYERELTRLRSVAYSRGLSDEDVHRIMSHRQPGAKRKAMPVSIAKSRHRAEN